MARVFRTEYLFQAAKKPRISQSLVAAGIVSLRFSGINKRKRVNYAHAQRRTIILKVLLGEAEMTLVDVNNILGRVFSHSQREARNMNRDFARTYI